MTALPARSETKAPSRKRPASPRPRTSGPANEILSARPSERIDAAQRRAMIEEAAYFHAEHRGFEPGHELDDWLAAEDQIAATLSLMDLQAAALLESLKR
jgi:hypothetical protein